MEGSEHHVTVPTHDVLRIGTLAAIVDDVAGHLQLSRVDVLREIRR